MEKSKAEKLLERIRDYIGGELKISRRGVPYLTLDKFSICYFGRDKFLRTWKIDSRNTKFMDFKTYGDLVRFFHNELNYKYVGNWYL